jgi:transposase-like protein
MSILEIAPMGAKEDLASWSNFLRHLQRRGLEGIQLVISDKCLGLVEAGGQFSLAEVRGSFL